jgi:hypothetical protein
MRSKPRRPLMMRPIYRALFFKGYPRGINEF